MADPKTREVVVELLGVAANANINQLCREFEVDPKEQESAIHQAIYSPERLFLALRITSEDDIEYLRRHSGVLAVWTERQANKLFE